MPPLADALVASALARGAAEARAQIGAGRIVAAVLSLQGRWSVVGDVAAALPAAAATAAPAAMPRLRVESSKAPSRHAGAELAADAHSDAHAGAAC